MENNNRITPSLIASIVLLISFFLPWIDVKIFSLSGYDIPKMLHFLARFKEEEDIGVAWKAIYLVYLLPVSSIYLIYAELKKVEKYTVLAKGIVVAISFFVFFAYALEKFEIIGIGLFATFGCGIFFLISLGKEFSGDPIKKGRAGNFKRMGMESLEDYFLKLKKYSKPILFSIIGCLIVLFLYSWFAKNSYEKAVNAFEEGNWEKTLFYIDKTRDKVQKEEFEPDFEENKMLNVMDRVSRDLKGIDELRQDFSKADSLNLEDYRDYHNRLVSFPIKDILENVDFPEGDIKAVLNSSIRLNDSICLGFARSILDEELKKALEDTILLDYQTSLDNVSLLCDQVISQGENKKEICSEKIDHYRKQWDKYHYFKGSKLFSEEDYERAKNAYEKVNDTSLYYSNSLFPIININYHVLGNYDEMIRQTKTLLKLDRVYDWKNMENYLQVLKSKASNKVGVHYINNVGDLERGMYWYKKSIGYDSSNSKALYNAANITLYQKDTGKALKYEKKAIAVDSSIVAYPEGQYFFDRDGGELDSCCYYKLTLRQNSFTVLYNYFEYSSLHKGFFFLGKLIITTPPSEREIFHSQNKKFIIKRDTLKVFNPERQKYDSYLEVNVTN